LGKAGKFKFDPRQRAIVKVHYFGHGGGGGAALGAHARYVARDAAAKAPSPPLPGEDGATSGEREVEAPAKAHARYLQRGAERSSSTMRWTTASMAARVRPPGRARTGDTSGSSSPRKTAAGSAISRATPAK
jgi:hypothetical protein